jgi:hypothetical protein
MSETDLPVLEHVQTDGLVQVGHVPVNGERRTLMKLLLEKGMQGRKTCAVVRTS